MNFRNLVTTMGMIAVCSTISFGQNSNGAVPEDQNEKHPEQTARADSQSTGGAATAVRDEGALRGPKPTRTYGFIGVGVHRANPDDLNGKLNASGISAFDPAAFNLSFGNRLEVRRLILEGELSGLVWGEKIDNGVRTSLYATTLKGCIGVNCFPEGSRVSLSPFAGAGLGMAGLRIRNDKKTLSRAMENSDPHALLWQGSFLTQIGVAADAVLASPDKQNGFVVGIRCGYQFAPLQSSWYSDDTQIPDVPDLKQRGVFAKLVLGGWTPPRHKRCCCEKH